MPEGAVVSTDSWPSPPFITYPRAGRTPFILQSITFTFLDLDLKSSSSKTGNFELSIENNPNNVDTGIDTKIKVVHCG